MNPQPEIGSAEIRALNETMSELKEAVKELRGEIASTYVRKDVLEPQLAELRKEVDGHANWLLWAQRLIIGAVIVALLGLVILQGGNPA